LIMHEEDFETGVFRTLIPFLFKNFVDGNRS